MRGRGFPWSKLLMVLLVFVAGFIAHDIRSHGSFTGSSSLLVKITSLYVCSWGLTTCGLFQIPAQPSISAAQGSQLYLNRPGAKYQCTPNRVSGITSLFLSQSVFEQSFDHYNVCVAFSSHKWTKLPSTMCQIFVKCLSLLGFVLVGFCTLCLNRGRSRQRIKIAHTSDSLPVYKLDCWLTQC